MLPGLLSLVGLLPPVFLAAATASVSGLPEPQVQCDSKPAEADSQVGVQGNTQAMVLLQKQAMQGVSQPLLALLEDKHVTMVCRGKHVTKVDPEEEDDGKGPPQEVFGDIVPLNPEGFKAVMDQGCGFEKELFVGRVAQELELAVKDQATLRVWMQVVYKEAHTFEDLKALVAKTAQDGESNVFSHPQPVASIRGAEDGLPGLPATPVLDELPGSFAQLAVKEQKIPSLAAALGVAPDRPALEPDGPAAISLVSLSDERKPAPVKKKVKKEEAPEEEELIEKGMDKGHGKKKQVVKQSTKKGKPEKKQSMVSAKHSTKTIDEEEEEEEDTDDESSREGAFDGQSAPLNQQGYIAVTQLGSTEQMEAFVRRAIADRGLHVVDDGALRGVVPYYSGAKATQSWNALVSELKRAEKMKKKPWISSKELEETDTQTPSIQALTHAFKNPSAKNSLVQTLAKKQTTPLSRRLNRLVKSGRSASGGKVHPIARPEFDKRQRRTPGSLVQTHSRSDASSESSWIGSAFVLVQGQAAYWLGARATLVACGGSLLFGLFLFDESAHHKRAAALEPEEN